MPTPLIPFLASLTLNIPFYGMSWEAEVQLDPVTPAEKTLDAVITADRSELAPLARLVDRAATEATLDDYGRIRLAVAAVDALPTTLDDTHKKNPPTAGQALARGSWGPTGRLTAITAVLRELGYGASLFGKGSTIVLGVHTADTGLNIDAVTERSRIGSGPWTEVRWMLWSGTDRLGDLGPLAGKPTRILVGDFSGKPATFAGRTLPDFTLRRVEPRTISVAGTETTLSVAQRPDAADYLDLYPEFDLAHQATLAREELRLLGLDEGLRTLAKQTKDEVELLDRLLVTYQAAFAYEPGPLEPLFSTIASGNGDCDQLSLLTLVSLREMGYGTDDLLGVEWADHIGLAIHPHKQGPEQGVQFEHEGDTYFVMDLTFYEYLDGKLVSRWGHVGPGHGAQVSVLPLEGLE